MNKYTHSVLILLLWINIAHRAYSSHPHSLTTFAQQAVTHRIVLYNKQHKDQVLTFLSQKIPNTQHTYYDKTNEKAYWIYSLNSIMPILLIIDQSDTIQGIISYQQPVNEYKLFINSFATIPQKRFGTTLLCYLVNAVSTEFHLALRTHKSNTAAQAAYAHLKFTQNTQYTDKEYIEYRYDIAADPYHFRLPKTFNTILKSEWDNLLILPQKNTDLCVILPFRNSSYSTFCSRHWYATLFTMGIIAATSAYYVYNRTPKALVSTVLLPMIHYGIYQHGQRQNEHLLQKTYGGNFPLLDNAQKNNLVTDVANTIHGPAHVIATVPKVFFQNYLHKTFPDKVTVH